MITGSKFPPTAQLGGFFCSVVVCIRAQTQGEINAVALIEQRSQQGIDEKNDANQLQRFLRPVMAPYQGLCRRIRLDRTAKLPIISMPIAPAM